MANNRVNGNETLIPNNSGGDVVSMSVLVEGKAIDQEFQLMSLVTTNEVNRIPSAKLVFRDGSAADQNFPVSESDTFVPGNSIEIKMGHDQHNDTVFKGIIVKQSLQAKGNGASTLTVDCRDKAFKLTLGRFNRYFIDKKDSDAISQLVSNGGLSADIKATNYKHPELIQYYVSDWDFILTRAELNAQLVIVSDGKLTTREPTIESPVLLLVFGENLYDFETELDARTQIGDIVATSWDYKTQATIESNSSASNFQELGNLTGKSLASKSGLETLELRHGGNIADSELKSWADSALMRSRLAKIRGRCKFQGTSIIKTGVTVELKGMGARFNGKAFVTAVRHEMNNGTWFTHAQFGLAPEFLSQKLSTTEYAAPSLLPSVSGLQIGVVVRLQGDPQAEDRILVKLPILDNKAEGTWARVSTLDAGNNRGSYFRPEIGDEVIIGFINDDPRETIVLGMLNSSKLPAPLPTTDKNDIKGFITRSNIKVLFDDDKKIITMETPGGNKIIVSDDEKSITSKDQNGNSWKMSDSGIEIKSPKDITIEATGKLILKATQDVTIEGMNVKAKAKTELALEGTAKASLKASGQTEVKGGMVMIN